METLRPQSKNVFTLMWATAIATLGVIVVLILNKTGHTLFMGPELSASPYLNALYPLLFAGIPVITLSGFIFGLFSLGREDTKTGRWQVGSLMTILVVLAYLFSFLGFTGS